MFTIYQKPLIIFGLFIYLTSLLLGVFLTKFRNPRMALSTHVTGLMIGIYSLALAAISQSIQLNSSLAALAFYLHLVGNLLLTISLGLAAVWNTQSKTPIAGAKELGLPFHEMVVKRGIILSSILLIISCAILLVGAL